MSKKRAQHSLSSHPALKNKQSEKKQWLPSKYQKVFVKRRKKGWRCGEKPPNRKKAELPTEKHPNMELALESREPETSCQEASQSPQSPEWSASSPDTISRSKKAEPIHQKTREFVLQTCFGEVLLAKDGPILNGTKSKEKEKGLKRNEQEATLERDHPEEARGM